jgi:quinol monooxygenase YgiN
VTARTPSRQTTSCRDAYCVTAEPLSYLKREETMIHVVAIITAKPGKRDEILKNFKANVPAVHAEKGCIEYGATIDTDGGPFAKFGPDTFVVIEKWDSMDDLKAHGASAHMKAYGEKNKDLVANRAVHVLQNA